MFTVVKYKGKWAVLDTKTRVYYFIGAGKSYCEERAIELNKE
jgi:hypothetical protein